MPSGGERCAGPAGSPETPGDHTGNPPDHPKMLMVGTVDRSTRQTIIATLDRAAPSGNQGTTPVGPSPVRLWTDLRS